MPIQVHFVALRPYTASAAHPARALEVQVEYTATGALHLRYALSGDLGRIRVPSVQPSRRRDELWKHTCFEAFTRVGSGPAYRELNVSPSTEWALYAFDDYRRGMAPLDVPEPPQIRVERSEQTLVVEVRLRLAALPAASALALAAVIEDESGSLSYWALKHPAGKPDFHDAGSFALQL